MIDVEQRGHISVFHMTHGKANALDVEFCEAITARLEAYRHASAQALVLIGHGQIFSAGVDLLRLLEGGEALDLALLDVNLGSETAYGVADALSRRDVPFIFVSGYGASGLDQGYAAAPVLAKPFQPATLARTIGEILALSTEKK